MVLQLPPEPEADELLPAVQDGVIDDARARHRRERWAGATIAAIAIAAGLIFGLGGGGGGGGSGHQAGGRGGPRGGGQQTSRPLAVITHVGQVSEFGLLAPGLGWVFDGGNFSLTRDGGARWSVLSRSSARTHRSESVAGLAVDVAAAGPFVTEPGLSTAPVTRVTALGFNSVAMRAACARPAPAAAGVVALSGDAGTTWNTHVLPGCADANSLSFISARVGYAVLSPSAHDSEIYRTLDGGARWRLVSRFPSPMTVSFGNRSDGLAWVTPNTRTDAAVLYRTTDGGRSWQRSRFCGPADPTYTVYCGVPTSFGRHDVVLAVAQNLARPRSDHAYIYSSADAGRSWSRHAVPPLTSPQMPAFSAPNPDDLFLYASSGMLYRSTDGGRSWRSTAEPQFKQLYEMQFVDADYGWILAEGHFDYTVDGGRSWRPVGSH